MNILRAEAYVKQYPQFEKLADVYDDDEMLASALNTLIPQFEYPDFSHLTVGDVFKKYQAKPLPLTGSTTA